MLCIFRTQQWTLSYETLMYGQIKLSMVHGFMSVLEDLLRFAPSLAGLPCYKIQKTVEESVALGICVAGS